MKQRLSIAVAVLLVVCFCAQRGNANKQMRARLAREPVTYYVATNGTANSAGTAQQPWNYSYFLTNTLLMGLDIVIVRDGTHDIHGTNSWTVGPSVNGHIQFLIN